MTETIIVNGQERTMDDYTLEYCSECDDEVVIYSKGITKCPECGTPTAPCSMCDHCSSRTCPYGCGRGWESDSKITATNPDITKEEINFFLLGSGFLDLYAIANGQE